jgi:micrococcal nuclease
MSGPFTLEAPPPLYWYRFGSVDWRVVDGDTLWGSIDLGFHIVKHDYVRLAGLNTPEIFGSHATDAGKLAQRFTYEWLTQRPVLWLHSQKYDEREKYGRVLGVIYAEGDPVSLNDALLAGGYAVPMAD